MLFPALLPIDIRMFECAYPQLFTLVCWIRDCETGLHVDYELHASRCRRSLCEIPSRTANGGRLTERARLKEPIKCALVRTVSLVRRTEHEHGTRSV